MFTTDGSETVFRTILWPVNVTALFAEFSMKIKLVPDQLYHMQDLYIWGWQWQLKHLPG